MKLTYYPPIRTPFTLISLSNPVWTAKRSPRGLCLTTMPAGTLLELTLTNASKKVHLKELTLSKLPTQVQTSGSY